jgi:hypothetical protein
MTPRSVPTTITYAFTTPTTTIRTDTGTDTYAPRSIPVLNPYNKRKTNTLLVTTPPQSVPTTNTYAFTTPTTTNRTDTFNTSKWPTDMNQQKKDKNRVDNMLKKPSFNCTTSVKHEGIQYQSTRQTSSIKKITPSKSPSFAK